MRQCLLSFIVPVYNRVHLLERCVHSVVQADCEDVEILLIDDASTDGSAQLCEKLAAQFSAVRYHLQPRNKGPGAARNQGLSMARGKFVFFLDSDDTIETKELGRILDVLEKHKDADIVTLNPITINTHGEVRPKQWVQTEGQFSVEEFLCQFPMWPGSSLWVFIFRTKFLTTEKITLPETYSIEDLCFSIQAFSTARQIYSIPVSFCRYHADTPDSLYKILAVHQKLEGFSAYLDIFYKIPPSKTQTKPFQIALNKAIASTADTLPAEQLVRQIQKLEKKEPAFLQKPDNIFWKRYGTYMYLAQWERAIYTKISKSSENFKKKVFLCPAGRQSLHAANMIKSCGGQVDGFLDNNPISGNPHVSLVQKEEWNVFPFSQLQKESSLAMIYTDDLPVGLALENQIIQMGRRLGQGFMTIYT